MSPHGSDRVLASAPRARSFLGYIPLTSAAKALFLGVVLLGIIVNAFFLAFGGQSPAQGAMEIAVLSVSVLFIWKPPAAALSIVALGPLALLAGAGGGYGFALAVLGGVVVYSCSRWLTAAFYVSALAWILCAELYLGQISTGGFAVLGFVGLAAGLIGGSIRRTRSRETDLHADIDRLTYEVSSAIQDERDRIADELHNVIAHDITIVSMHAKALRLDEDDSGRQRSIEAIDAAAAQALTDLRRMLRAVRTGSSGASDLPSNEGSAEQTARAIRAELSAMGIATECDVKLTSPVSSTVNTAIVHIMREAATNIIKHAPGSKSATFSCVSKGDAVELAVSNAGSAASQSGLQGPTGFGLVRIAERVELLGGDIVVNPTQAGWSISVMLPTS